MNWVQATLLAPIYAERMKKRKTNSTVGAVASGILFVAALLSDWPFPFLHFFVAFLLFLVGAWCVADAVDCRRILKKLERHL